MSTFNNVADSFIANSLAQAFGVELPQPEPSQMQLALQLMQQKRLDEDLKEGRLGFFATHLKSCVGDCAKTTDVSKLCFLGGEYLAMDRARLALQSLRAR